MVDSTDVVGVIPRSDATDASGIVYISTVADKTREILHILSALPTHASSFQSTIGELESALLSERELRSLVSGDLSCFRNQISGFQTFHLAKIGILLQLSARYRARLQTLATMNDEAMNASDGLLEMINSHVSPELWRCLLGLNEEASRVHRLLDQRRAMHARPLSAYLEDVIAVDDPPTTDRGSGGGVGASAPNIMNQSEVAFDLATMQCTMLDCFHEMATFWTHLMSRKDDSMLMVVLHKTVQQLLVGAQASLLHTRPIPAFQVVTSGMYDASEHRAFIYRYIHSQVDLWKYHGAAISEYVMANIQDSLVSYIPPSMHALRIKAIAPRPTPFDAHIAATVVYDLHNNGATMLSSYNEQAHLHSVALVFVELLGTYASILRDVMVVSASVAQCTAIGPHVRGYVTNIAARFDAIHGKLVRMWQDQFRLGISVCNNAPHRTPSTEALCTRYTQMREKLDALSDVRHLDEAIPTSVEFPYMSTLSRIASCLHRIKSGLNPGDARA